MNHDIISDIFEWLDWKIVLNISTVSKLFNQVSNNHIYWKNNFKKEFCDDILKYENIFCSENYKEIFVNYFKLRNCFGSLKIVDKKNLTLEEFIKKKEIIIHHDYELKQIPLNISLLPNLLNLFLFSNKINSNFHELRSIKNLQKLYLCSNDIKEFPKEILQQINLKILDLSFNLISEIPTNLIELNCLVTLNFSHNRINKIPKNIEQLSNLEELYLQYNNIKKIPKNIINLTKLTKLNLSRNMITIIPNGIIQMEDLQYFSTDH